jgi:hypothetical protein
MCGHVFKWSGWSCLEPVRGSRRTGFQVFCMNICKSGTSLWFLIQQSLACPCKTHMQLKHHRMAGVSCQWPAACALLLAHMVRPAAPVQDTAETSPLDQLPPILSFRKNRGAGLVDELLSPTYWLLNRGNPSIYQAIRWEKNIYRCYYCSFCWTWPVKWLGTLIANQCAGLLDRE